MLVGSLPYKPSLEGIRALAFLLVFMVHFSGETWGLKGHPVVEYPWLLLCQISFCAVPVFFALSGFLITAVLRKSLDQSGFFRVFYMRRALRILPLYYVTLAVVGLLAVHMQTPLLWRHALLFTYLYNFWPHDGYYNLNSMLHIGHLWSLAVEEQFYFVWPLILWRVRNRNSLIRFCLGLVALSFVARLTWPLWGIHSFEFIYQNTLFRCDAIVFGALIYLVSEQIPDVCVRWSGWARVVLAGGAAIIVVRALLHGEAMPFDTFGVIVLMPVLSLMGAALLVLTLNPSTFTAKASSWFWAVTLGKRSYALYIIHQLFVPFFLRSVKPFLMQRLGSLEGRVLCMVLGFAATCVVGEIAFRCLEVPTLHLKRHIRYGAASGSATPREVPFHAPPALPFPRPLTPRTLLSRLFRFINLELLLLFLIAAAYVAWIQSLPCFPSVDGPVHMYYAHILGRLLFDHGTYFAQYFYVRHWLPPYSVYYYLLVALERWMPMLRADQVVVTCYILLFIFGFRYLSSAVGPEYKAASLAGTLLVLNWSLGMGFLSYCLGMALSFWSLGAWLRALSTGSRRHAWTAVTVAGVVLLCHPVAFILLLALCTLLFATTLIFSPERAIRHSTWSHAKWNAVSLLVCVPGLLYVHSFSATHPFESDSGARTTKVVRESIHMADFYGRQHAVSFLYGRSPGLLAYRAGLLALLLVPGFFGLRQRWRNSQRAIWSVGDTFLVLGMSLILVLPFVPTKLNGCYYFAERMAIGGWLCLLLAASGYQRSNGERRSLLASQGLLPLTVKVALFSFIIVETGCLLYEADRLLRPAAGQVAALARERLAPKTLGVIFEDPRPPLGEMHQAVSWNPYYWALVNAFSSSDAVLANAPWMDESIIPVAPARSLPEWRIVSLQEPIPSHVEGVLLRHPRDLQLTLRETDFTMISRWDRDAALTRIPGRFESLLSPGSCKDEFWYTVCQNHVRQPFN